MKFGLLPNLHFKNAMWIVGGAALAVFVLSQPAAGGTVVAVNPYRVGATAEGFEPHECSDFPQQPDPDQDGWHFVTPGSMETFNSLELTFNDDMGDPQVITLPGPNGTIDGKHAFVI